MVWLQKNGVTKKWGQDPIRFDSQALKVRYIIAQGKVLWGRNK